jgi:hypothetical protein
MVVHLKKMLIIALLILKRLIMWRFGSLILLTNGFSCFCPFACPLLAYLGKSKGSKGFTTLGLNPHFLPSLRARESRLGFWAQKNESAIKEFES